MLRRRRERRRTATTHDEALASILLLESSPPWPEQDGERESRRERRVRALTIYTVVEEKKVPENRARFFLFSLLSFERKKVSFLFPPFRLSRDSDRIHFSFEWRAAVGASLRGGGGTACISAARAHASTSAWARRSIKL